MNRRFAVALLACGLVGFVAADPVGAASPDDVAARLDALGITSFGKKLAPETLGTLQAISLQGDKAKTLTDADCGLFATLPKVTTVTFNGARISKACLTELAKLPALGSLSLNSADFEPGALAALAPAITLDSLFFSDLKGLGIADLQALVGLPKLKSLGVSYASLPPSRTAWLNDAALTEIGKIRSLERLTLNRLSATATGMAEIAKLPALQELTMGYGTFHDEALAPLAGSKLSAVTINQNYRLGAPTVAILAKIPTLTRVDLWSTNAGGALAPLAGLPRLTTLTISSSFATDADLAALAAAPVLGTLNAYDCPGISDAGAKALASSKSLQSITLSRSTIGDDGAGELAKIPTLRSLALAEQAITDKAAAALAATKVSNLDLSGSDLTDEGLAALGKMPTLVTVSVRNTRVTDAGIAAFKAARPTAAAYK